MKIRGIGKVKAVQLKCLTELSTRMATMRARESLSFTEPSSIAEYYMERLRHEEQELLICMMFDTRNHLLGDAEISRGTVNEALIHPENFFCRRWLSMRSISYWFTIIRVGTRNRARRTSL